MQVLDRRARWCRAADGPSALFHLALQPPRRGVGGMGAGVDEHILDGVLLRANGASDFVGGLGRFGRFNGDVACRAQNIRVLFQVTRSLKSWS